MSDALYQYDAHGASAQSLPFIDVFTIEWARREFDTRAREDEDVLFGDLHPNAKHRRRCARQKEQGLTKSEVKKLLRIVGGMS